MQNYNVLKAHVLANCACKLNRNELKILISKFENDINSTRRFSATKSLNDLINFLEKNDTLNDRNLEVLKKVAIFVNDSESLRLIAEYEQKQNNILSNCNSYLQRNLPVQDHQNDFTINENINQRIANLDISAMSRKKDLCKDLLIRELGRSWKEFARGLNIREGEIDDIEYKFYNNFGDRIHEIFKIVEERKAVRTFRSDIENALRKARRNDLALDVAEILERD